MVDNLGTVRDLAKQDGTIAVHYIYDTYGNVTSGDTSLTRYLFTSREFDTATDLQYNRARWYDAETGRWLSEDPLGFIAGDANVGRYVGNRSPLLKDPSGMGWWQGLWDWARTTGSYAVPGSEATSALELAPEVAKTAVGAAAKKRLIEELGKPNSQQKDYKRVFDQYHGVGEKLDRIK